MPNRDNRNPHGLGLAGRVRQRRQGLDLGIMDPEFKDQKDFYKQIDEYINMGCKGITILNSLKELYKDQSKVEEINTSPYCPFEYYSDPEDKYKLTLDEVNLLLSINKSETKLLQGIKIGDLYKTTKIVLCDAPYDSDLLGSYSHEEKPPLSKSYYPVVRIYMDRVEAVAKELGRERKYIIASVYIHEMMHRYYDIRPDLGWKKSVKEIEEPMAVFGTMKFCEEFDKETLLQISRRLTEDLRKSKWYDLLNYYVYILGIKMYDSNVDACLIETYRHVSLMMHKESEVKGFDNPIGKYLDTCEKKKDSLENLVEPIKKCIETYAKFFPQDKGTK